VTAGLKCGCGFRDVDHSRRRFARFKLVAHLLDLRFDAAMDDSVLMAALTTGLSFLFTMALSRSLRRGKGPVAAESGAAAVGRHDSEMISCVGTQAADVGSDIPEGVPSLSLHSGGVPVAGRGAILERNTRSQAMRIE